MRFEIVTNWSECIFMKLVWLNELDHRIVGSCQTSRMTREPPSQVTVAELFQAQRTLIRASFIESLLARLEQRPSGGRTRPSGKIISDLNSCGRPINRGLIYNDFLKISGTEILPTWWGKWPAERLENEFGSIAESGTPQRNHD
jgi:hypothetical protein